MTDSNNNPISGVLVDFFVNGAYVGNGIFDIADVTDEFGTVSIFYNIMQGAGIYQILAQFAGNDTYSGTKGTNNLTVDILPTTLTIDNPANDYYKDKIILRATLTDSFSNPVSYRTVKFRVNNGAVYVATTDINGVATYQYTPTLGATTYQIFAEFLGDEAFMGSSATSSTTLIPTPTGLTVVPKSGYYNNSVALTANLTDTVQNTPLSGKTINFTVNDSSVGSAVTGANGIATYYYNPLTLGILQYFAQFAGGSGYAGSSSGDSTITVSTTPTIIRIIAPVSGIYHNLTYPNTITATLGDGIKGFNGLGMANGPLSGKTLEFFVGGVSIGTAITNSGGVATLPYTSELGAGQYSLSAQFIGDAFYNPSSATAANKLTIVSTPTVLNATAVSGNYNSTVNLTATLKENVTVAKNLIYGKTINFSVNGVSIGSAVTDANGVATYQYSITHNPGIYSILAQFAGDSGYGASSSTKNLTVSIIPTSLVVNPVSGYYNGPVNLNATLTDITHNIPVSGQTVNFSVNGVSVGSAVTDANGVATYQYTTTQGAGIHQILAQFAGTTGYNVSNGTNNLNVNYIPISIFVNPVSGHYGDWVNLTATLTDIIHNTPVNGKIVNFTVNGASAGSIQTDVTGLANLPYNMALNAGTYLILVQFLGDNIYSGSTGSSNLNTDLTPTQIVVNPSSGPSGSLVNLTATLTDIYNGVPLSGQQVNFDINGSFVGSAQTNALGVATYEYTITQGVGIYQILAQFFGNTMYAASSNTNNLTVTDVTSPIVNANPAGGLYNTTKNVVLTANEPATIYYTTNGSNPTTSSAQYSAPIAISANTVLKFFAVDTAGNPSGIYTRNLHH